MTVADRRAHGPAGRERRGPPGPRADVPTEGRILAVDWGERRIGLAISDPTQTLAQPLATLTRRSGKRFPMRRFRGHVDELRPVGVVVGVPIDEQGSETEHSAAARRLGERIALETGLPVAFLDERMSTARARSAIRDLGGRVRGREADVDQLAATVLLQTFLDSRR